MTKMTPPIILITLISYFIFLMLIAQLTKGKSDNKTFFTGNRNSNWFLVAFGMIGVSLSGVTFISIPGWVKGSSFSYMQMVFGYIVGYYIIATVLIPLYYRLKLITIYTYLGRRFGNNSHKTGSAFFIISRVVGASLRLYLVANVLQYFVFDYYDIPFLLTVVITIILIWIYTFQGGIRTIVFTDTLQTFFMLLSLVLSIYFIYKSLNFDFPQLITEVKQSEYSKIFFFDDFFNDKKHFAKRFFSGALMALVMTGLDQDMMQKNLTCKSLKEAQWNMGSFVFVLFFVNILFLALGALLYMYSANIGLSLPKATDQLYPLLALKHFPTYISITFLIGFIAAAFSSADSALTSLTTSFSTDFLGISTKPEETQPNDKKNRIITHISFSLIVMALVIVADQLSEGAVINKLFKFAGYTYGPLLGMFAFGILTKRQIKDNLVIPVTLAAAIFSVILDLYSERIFNGFTFGFFILAVNGLITFFALWLISSKAKEHDALDDLTIFGRPNS